MNILVTGGAGFIGSHTVDLLVQENYEVEIFDALEPQVHPNSVPPSYLNKKAKFTKGNILDQNSLRKSIEDKDVVFHFASLVGVGQSQYEIKRYVDTNICGTANLLDIIVNSNNSIKKIIFASSMSIYGEGTYWCQECKTFQTGTRTEEQLSKQNWEPYCEICDTPLKMAPTNESALLNSKSIYAVTKKTQEEMIMTTGKNFNIPTVALRYFNVYGTRQSINNPYTGVIAIFISRMKNGKSPIIYEDGLQTRDFISVKDIAKTNVLAMEKNDFDFGVFNVGSGKAASIINIAEILEQQFGIKPVITHSYRKGDIRHCFADISKLQKIESIKFPKVSLEEGIKELLEWSQDIKSEDKFENVEKILREKKLILDGVDGI